MKQERVKEYNSVNSRNIYDPGRPRTRAFIKKEAEDSKEYYRRVLRNQVTREAPHSEANESENSDTSIRSTESVETSSYQRKNRYCDICNFTYDSWALYKKHQVKIHTSPPVIDMESFYCNVCDRTYSSSGAYRSHMYFIHDIKLPTFKTKDDGVNTLKYCITCDKDFPSRNYYRNHLISAHGVDMPLLFKPNEFDLKEKLCKICNKTFSDSRHLGIHMRGMHAISTVTSRFIYPDLKPDVDNPNNYCATCDKTYTRKDVYWRHLAIFHIESMPELYQGVKCDPEDMVYERFKSYCKKCHRKILTKLLLEIHREKIHKIKRPKRIIPKASLAYPDLSPDVDNPSNYCAPCDRTYYAVSGYRKHLQDYHDMTLPPKTKLPCIFSNFRKISDTLRKMKPIIDFDTNYCNVCDKKYCHKHSYRRHLIEVHEMVVSKTNSRPVLRRDKIPVIDEAQRFCTACSITYSTRSIYRQHLQVIHDILLPAAGIKTTEKPDIDNPNNHCTACKRDYSCKGSFFRHLESVHNLFPKRKTLSRGNR